MRETSPATLPAPDRPRSARWVEQRDVVTEQEATCTFWGAALEVKTLLVGVFVNRLSAFLNVFLVLFVTARGYSAGQAAFALAAYGVGAVAGVLMGGLLANFLGARNATVLSMGASSVLLAALAHLSSYGLIITAVVFVGVVAQLYRPASATLLSELTQHGHQVMIFAMYRFGLNLGAAIAPLLGFGLYTAAGHSYSVLFYGEAFIALTYAVIAWRALPAVPRRATAMTSGTSRRRSVELGGYGAMFMDRRYMLFLVAMFLQSAMYVQYLSTLPLTARAVGLSTFWYTLAVSLNGIIVIAFEISVTKSTQAWPVRRTFGLGLGLISVGIASYSLPLGPAAIIIGTVIWSAGEIFVGPVIFAYPGLVGPPQDKARYISSFQLVFGIGAAVGPVLGEWLFAQFRQSVWLVLGVCAAVAAGLAVVAVGGVRDPRVEV